MLSPAVFIDLSLNPGKIMLYLWDGLDAMKINPGCKSVNNTSTIGKCGFQGNTRIAKYTLNLASIEEVKISCLHLQDLGIWLELALTRLSIVFILHSMKR